MIHSLLDLFSNESLDCSLGFLTQSWYLCANYPYQGELSPISPNNLHSLKDILGTSTLS